MAAKEKTASGGAPFAEPKTRVWGLLPGNGNGIGGCWPVTSTHVWGCWHVYAETASGGLVNRYYSNAYGRFMTPDPYANGGRSSDPQSWNRYAYTRGDPVNSYDPHGTDPTDGGDGGSGTDPNSADNFTCDTSWESDAALPGNPCGISVPSPWGGGMMIYINIAGIVAAAEAAAQSAASQLSGGCTATQSLSGTFLYWCLHNESNVLKSDISTLRKRLKNDPDCAKWLGQNITAKGGLERAIAKLKFGEATAITSASGLLGAFNGTANEESPGYNIAISDAALGGGLGQALETIIHELAHEFNVPGFAPEISNGQLDTALEQREAQEIQDHCSKTLGVQ